jgi:hypothetical protein
VKWPKPKIIRNAVTVRGVVSCWNFRKPGIVVMERRQKGKKEMGKWGNGGMRETRKEGLTGKIVIEV